MENEQAVRVAVNIIMESVLNILQEDPHQWSKRPCQTCKAISAIVGKPFGCEVERTRRNK